MYIYTYMHTNTHTHTHTHTRMCMNTQGCPDMCCGRCCQLDTCPRHAGATEQGAAAGGHRRRVRGNGVGRAGQVRAPDVGVGRDEGRGDLFDRTGYLPGGPELLGVPSLPPPVPVPSERFERGRGRGRLRGRGGFVAGSNDTVRPGVGAARPPGERERRWREREREREQRNSIPLAIAPSVLFGRWLGHGGDAGP